MSHPQTFPRGLAPDYRGVAVGTTLGKRNKNVFNPQGSLAPSRPLHKATAVFSHAGGRLVVPNTGEPTAESFGMYCIHGQMRADSGDDAAVIASCTSFQPRHCLSGCNCLLK